MTTSLILPMMLHTTRSIAGKSSGPKEHVSQYEWVGIMGVGWLATNESNQPTFPAT